MGLLLEMDRYFVRSEWWGRLGRKSVLSFMICAVFGLSALTWASDKTDTKTGIESWATIIVAAAGGAAALLTAITGFVVKTRRMRNAERIAANKKKDSAELRLEALEARLQDLERWRQNRNRLT